MRQHPTKWTVLYPNGSRSHHSSEEEARAMAVLHGIGLTPPLYRHE
jgi:hypothetical protein